MAFHSRNSSQRNSRGYKRGETESILGLSGWLFADLLLAIAIIFLVIQSRPGSDTLDSLRKEMAVLRSENDALKEERAGLKEGAKGGLIADESKQLIIEIRKGTRIQSAREFEAALGRSNVTLGNEPTTLAELKKMNFQVGFIIWYASDSKLSKRSAQNNLKYLVEALLNKNLIARSNLSDRTDLGKFPCLCNYEDELVRGSDLRLRIFLYQLLNKK